MPILNKPNQGDWAIKSGSFGPNVTPVPTSLYMMEADGTMFDQGLGGFNSSQNSAVFLGDPVSGDSYFEYLSAFTRTTNFDTTFGIASYPFTFAAIVRVPGVLSIPTTIVSIADPLVGNIKYALELSTTNQYSRLIAQNTSQKNLEHTVNLNDGLWHLIVGVFASAVDRRIYADNFASVQHITNVIFAASTIVGAFGFRNDGTPSNYADADVAAVMIWDGVALTDTQIAVDLWNGGSPWDYLTLVTASPPVLSTPTDSETAWNTSTGSVVTDIAEGNIVAVITQSATTPTHAQIIAGQDHLGAVADASSAVAAVVGTNNINFSSLSSNTAYFTHFTQNSANVPVPVSANGFTTLVNQAPVVDAPISDQVCTIGIAFGPLDVSGNFSDPEGNALSYSQTGLPNGLVISAAGIISGIPTGGFQP